MRCSLIVAFIERHRDCLDDLDSPNAISFPIAIALILRTISMLSILLITCLLHHTLQGELPPELDRVAFSNRRAASFIEACLQHQNKRPSAAELLADDFLRPNEVS